MRAPNIDKPHRKVIKSVERVAYILKTTNPQETDTNKNAITRKSYKHNENEMQTFQCHFHRGKLKTLTKW